MSLYDIFQKKFPFAYFETDFFIDLLDKSIKALIKSKGETPKEKKEKKYYEGINADMASGKDINIKDVQIFESDVKILDDNIIEGLKFYIPADLAKKEIQIDMNDFKQDSLVFLTIRETPGLFLKKGFLPVVYNKQALLGELLKSKGVTFGQYIKYCFDSGLFTSEFSVEEIKDRFDNITYTDDDGLDRFLYCAEELLNVNIVLISNKFVACDNCERYFFLTQLDKRVIREDRPIYFVYRYVEPTTESVTYLNIDFLDLSKKAIGDLGEFSKKRLIRKYNENYELSEVRRVEWEPTDIDRELPIIELEIDSKLIRLLVGSTYNLYTLDKKLVGRIDILDFEGKNGTGNIEWIDKYPRKLL